MTDCYVLAPVYQTKPKLKYAQEEADFLLEKFPAPAGFVIKPADFQNLADVFGIQGKTIVHFACHGGVENGRQVIYLENEVPLSATMVKGVAVMQAAFEDKQPFVFLNACEVGRQIPALLGVGGFAQSFIDLGASAVIAPLWSVKDDLAHQIAVEFYNTVEANPGRRFADILRSIRARAYDPQNGEDTYAAYCFYGDPLSSAKWIDGS
jgi:CHAT domain-containing protein